MTFTITPNSGYEIANVIVDGQSIGAVASYTFENVTANGLSIYATFAVVETCYTITGLEVSVETYGNVLNWNAAENAVSYNIYRNNGNTILANIATTSYIDLNGNVGDSYRIVTVCQHGESESSESVTATPSGIDENSISVNLYPNPTNGSFMIECNGMSSIEVFNMVGQLVKQIDVNTDKTSIDASTWAKGVYSIRIATADSNNEMVMGVPYTTTIKIGNTPVQDALVCISQNGSYYRGYTDANGQVSISNDFSVGEALLVVTAYNTTTIYQTIPVNTANEPYISIQNYSPQNVSFGTTNNLSMTLVNMGGVATTGNTTVTLTTSDQYLTLNTASATFGTMAAQGGTASSSSFNFSVAENTPDGHVATINATITNGSYTWNSTMSITIAGPACDAPTGLDVTVNGSSATITWDTQVITPVTISDDFEGHTAFTINSPGTVGWTYIDGDGSTTGAISGYNSWNNANSEMAYIVFDPSQVTSQSGSGNLSSSITAHSGSQFLASFYITSQNTNLQNDDWIVSPELNFAEDFTFSFYCRGGHKSNNNSYTETYEVYYSTTTNDKSAFTNLIESATVTGGNNIQWTYKTYTVPSSAKYVAIKYASTDKYYFCIDDITISGTINIWNSEGTI